MKQKLNYARKNWPDNLSKYDDQEKKLAGRNSYCKADPDVTFMRMKEDYMLNTSRSVPNRSSLNYSPHHTTHD